MIQRGASLVYVKDQMGHSSIQVTVDIYGHLIPSADIGWVDKLDDLAVAPTEVATGPQPPRNLHRLRNQKNRWK
jgi:integrase